jgi:hypothetical protein
MFIFIHVLNDECKITTTTMTIRTKSKIYENKQGIKLELEFLTIFIYLVGRSLVSFFLVVVVIVSFTFLLVIFIF